ncbi:MAG: ATP-binding protein [Nitrospinae bacterium]|nr:ATP-binding protein [Nitrospinota bacterium]
MPEEFITLARGVEVVNGTSRPGKSKRNTWMITLVEALNYRCLRYVSRPLDPFHVLVGPNASGKTTFLDVVGFLRDLVSEGLDEALSSRTTNPEELLFRRQGEKLELAVEARIPDELRILTAKPEMGMARYEVSIGFDDTQRQFEFKAETFLLKQSRSKDPIQRSLFPMPIDAPPSLLTKGRGGRNYKTVVNKVPGGNDNFYSETYPQGGKGWAPSFKLGLQKSALGNLPADEKSLPVASWFREYLKSGVQQFVLNSLAIRQPSPPTRVKGFLPDGSNLPWVVARLRQENKERYDDWIAHLRTALDDLVDITTVERPEDKHCYMVYGYNGGLKVPSWMVSDGTLRLTALTLPAYLDELKGIYLIEEPENGIHPRAVATVYDSLSSVYSAQVLLATHSPVVLSAAKMDDVLCFAKDDIGATDIVLGSEHPKLQQWHGEADLGTLLASGVLG